MTKESVPISGIETVDLNLVDLSQLWGLISPDLEHSVNHSTTQAPRLYLPEYGGILSSTIPGTQNLPGTDGPTDLFSGRLSIRPQFWGHR